MDSVLFSTDAVCALPYLPPEPLTSAPCSRSHLFPDMLLSYGRLFYSSMLGRRRWLITCVYDKARVGETILRI